MDWLYYLPPLAFGALHLAVMLLAGGHVVLTKRNVRAAIGWVGIIWLTPLVGATLYLLFGVNRLHRKARRLRGRQRGAVAASLVHCTQDQLDSTFAEHSDGLRPLVSFVGKLTHWPLLGGNRIEPLRGGDEAFPAMLEAIDAAEHSVGLGTYIFDNDALGRRFADALGRAQARGVQTRVLVDSLGLRYTWPSIRGVLDRKQVPLALFLPTLIPWKLQYSNLRNHRKLLIVDGRIGFTGGMNIRQGHLLSDAGRHPVADLHFRLQGPIVAQMRETFAADWEFSAGERLEGPEWQPLLSDAGHSLARGIADGPDIDYDKIQLTIQGAIDCAHRTIFVLTPYFLPDPGLITALNVAAMRGVEVNIILPAHNNLRLVEWACLAQLDQVLERGCRVWLTPLPFDHTKLLIVDDLWTMFGSANWDPRSFRLNFEFNVECYDHALAEQMRELARARIRLAHELTLEELEARPLWKKLRDGVARLAQPYL